MELFKTLFCNFVYYHRHSGNWGHYDMPILASFMMIYWRIWFTIMGTATMAKVVFNIVRLQPFMHLVLLFISVFIVALLYWRMVCGRRYIGILKNPKYYTKSRKILTLVVAISSIIWFFGSGAVEYFWRYA